MTIASVGYDGPVDEVGFSKMIPSVGASEYGVVGEADWLLTAHPTTAQAVNLSIGRGWGHGVYDESNSVATVQCDPITSGTRWDLIVMDRDWQPLNGLSEFGAVTGGTTKELPARLQGPGVHDQQPLWLVQWTAGQTQPTAIVDLRVWAGNGGMVGVDDLVRSYVEKVGTRVVIGGIDWLYRVGANSDAEWVVAGQIGKLPMFGFSNTRHGGTPSATTQFLVQSGTQVQNADGSGYGRITYPKPFPNGVLYASAVNGDASIDAAIGKTLSMPIAGSPHWPNPVDKTSFVYAIMGDNGQRLPGQLHRADWIVIGW